MTNGRTDGRTDIVIANVALHCVARSTYRHGDRLTVTHVTADKSVVDEIFDLGSVARRWSIARLKFVHLSYRFVWFGNRSRPPGRPLRPADKDAAMAWYTDVEQPKGSGIDPATNSVGDYFYGKYRIRLMFQR